MNTEIIDYRKFRSEVLREARLRAKIEKCFLCEQKGGPFCNSHLIPRFILKNISTDGNVLNFNRFQFIIFFFMDYAFVVMSKNYLPNLRSLRFSPVFSSKSYIYI